MIIFILPRSRNNAIARAFLSFVVSVVAGYWDVYGTRPIVNFETPAAVE